MGFRSRGSRCAALTLLASLSGCSLGFGGPGFIDDSDSGQKKTKISGRILGTDGKPAEGIQVGVGGASFAGSTWDYAEARKPNFLATTNADGAYSFTLAADAKGTDTYSRRILIAQAKDNSQVQVGFDRQSKVSIPDLTLWAPKASAKPQADGSSLLSWSAAPGKGMRYGVRTPGTKPASEDREPNQHTYEADTRTFRAAPNTDGSGAYYIYADGESTGPAPYSLHYELAVPISSKYKPIGLMQCTFWGSDGQTVPASGCDSKNAKTSRTRLTWTDARVPVYVNQMTFDLGAVYPIAAVDASCDFSCALIASTDGSRWFGVESSHEYASANTYRWTPSKALSARYLGFNSRSGIGNSSSGSASLLADDDSSFTDPLTIHSVTAYPGATALNKSAETYQAGRRNMVLVNKDSDEVAEQKRKEHNDHEESLDDDRESSLPRGQLLPVVLLVLLSGALARFTVEDRRTRRGGTK